MSGAAGAGPGPGRWQAVHVPKRGHSAEEYEDACAVNGAAGRYAVADGASESSFAGLWAKLLVERFVEMAGCGAGEAGAEWLEGCRRAWAVEVGTRPLPWYAEEKRDLGAFATFVGLVIDDSDALGNGGEWTAQAVGDACLFQVRRDRLLRAFPLERSVDFGNRPQLVGSRPGTAGAGDTGLVRGQGEWQPGDRFLLMTDALAQWFLTRLESGGRPWRELAFCTGEAAQEFPVWVAEQRQRDVLRNDDVTLLAVDL